MLIEIDKPFVNLELISYDLKEAFPEHQLILRQGIWESFIELPLSSLNSICIWYSPRERVIELTDNIPLMFFRKNARERRRTSVVIVWNPRESNLSLRSLLLAFGSAKRRKVRNDLSKFLSKQYSNH